MKYINDQQIARLLPYTELADVLAQAFRQGGATPVRQQYNLKNAAGDDANLLLMPAWQEGRKMGIKVVTVYPRNAERGLATVNASYLLLNAEDGMPELIMDGNELTRRRTAAASILAARYLARPDAKTLLMVGTGNMATHLIEAYCADRPITTVLVWGRRHERACQLGVVAARSGLVVEPVEDLASAVPRADIISCATLSADPLIRGEQLLPRQHLDLVGSFTPAMREVDNIALQRAELFVDTRSGALSEAGEFVQAFAAGVLTEADIAGDLFDLTRGKCPGRVGPESITLFKSVGTGLEDLAAAGMAAANMPWG